MTLATGSRGQARPATSSPTPATSPAARAMPSPCGVIVALGTLDARLLAAGAAYNARFPASCPASAKTFVAGTDTFARGWMQTFSDVARRYGVYILGSNNQPEFRESVDPSEIAAFADPDVPDPRSAFVATGARGLQRGLHVGAEGRDARRGRRPLRNVVTSNQKVPLTDDRERARADARGRAAAPTRSRTSRPTGCPGTRARMSFATSLPAFVYNGGPVTPFGEAPAAGIDPCSDTASYYMYCMDAARGQPRHAGRGEPGARGRRRTAASGSRWSG